MDVHNPPNAKPLKIAFRTDKVAKVVGKLADAYIPLAIRPKTDGDAIMEEVDEAAGRAKRIEPKGITGVLVQNEFKLSLMAPEDLREFAGLTTTTIICREHLTLRAAGIELIRWALQAAFGEVRDTTHQAGPLNGKSQHGNGAEEIADETIDRNTTILEVMGTVTVTVSGAGDVEVEWEGNMLNDGIADAVLGVLLGVERSPAAVAKSSKMHSHSHSHDHGNGASTNGRKRTTDPKERLSRLFLLLEAQFGADNVAPIDTMPTTKGEVEETDEVSVEKEMQKVLERLHRLGVPIPGVEVKMTEAVRAKIWLEDLSVECGNAIFRGRVEAVVKEAVEGVSPLWG